MKTLGRNGAIDHIGIMRKYIEDYSFSKKLQNSIDVCSIVNTDADLSNEIFDYAISFSAMYVGCESCMKKRIRITIIKVDAGVNFP